MRRIKIEDLNQMSLDDLIDENYRFVIVTKEESEDNVYDEAVVPKQCLCGTKEDV